MVLQVKEIQERYRNRSPERKKAEKEVVTGAGVTGAAVQMSRSKKAFDVFQSSKKLTSSMGIITNTTKNANMVAKKSLGLWAKVGENFKWARTAVLEWGAQFKNLKYVKPLIESAPFRAVAGIAGFGFGAVTFISGVSEIAKTATDVIDEHHFNKAA